VLSSGPDGAPHWPVCGPARGVEGGIVWDVGVLAVFFGRDEDGKVTCYGKWCGEMCVNFCEENIRRYVCASGWDVELYVGVVR